MEPLTLVSNLDFGILEVLDRGGKVVQRIEVDQTNLTIGRAYDSDIILDDPYVCPEHVSVLLQGDKLVVEDLDSINGISQNKYHFKGEKLELFSNDTFRIGHTTLRFRSANLPLHSTKIDRHIRHSFWTLKNPFLVISAFIVLLGFIIMEAIFSQTEETENVKILAEAIPAAMTIVGWAGLWALFGKLMIDRMSFFTHLGIFSVANVGFYLTSIVFGYLFYAFGFDSAYSTAFMIAVVAIVIWMLFTHLGYSTKMTSRSMLTVSVVFSLIGAGFYFLQSQVIESEFNYLPSYEVILKSPDFNFVSGDKLENFFTDTQQLKDLLKDSIKK